MNISANCLFSGSSLASEVHAAAVNGDKSTLQKLIAGNSELKDKEDQFGRTPLMYCVLADRLDCAEALLKAGADVNRADRSRRTALHLAAQKGNYRFMKLLLARRGNWMQKDLEDMTPLHLTTRHKSPKCLALLLKHMAPGEVDTQDRNKQTALHWSAYYNNPEHVKLLIKHDSNIGIPDIEGKIPLHWAANNKDPSAIHTVKCILEAAPTESLLNWQDYEGRTPLHFAVADGNVAVVDVLTSYEGCNVTSYDNLFRTPLHWAALLGHAQIVHLLLERNKFGTIPSDSQGATPLHYAAQSNFAETVEVFLKHPSVKDDSDLEGRTSFMWAAGKGSDDVIRTMLTLKLDIDINMTDKYAGTALHAAALSGHVSTVKLLLEHNAQVDALDVMKHTPLFRACEMGHKEVIQTLIKGGARVDLVDQDGHSPLHWAALGGNADVCQILIENKINPNVQDYAGRTPLQCAAYGGYINCMVVLLENNADPNIQDKEGRTALHWLCNNGYLDAIKLLLGFDAFPNHMENSEERYTPLDYALLGEHHEVIQFMLEHGALSIAAIQDIAAFKIQAVYKGYKVRKAFQERKNLLMKHEQLRKDAAAKTLLLAVWSQLTLPNEVLASCRAFLLTSRIPTKLELTFSYLEIQGVTSSKPGQLIMETEKCSISMKMASSEDVNEVLAHIGTCLRKIFPGLSPVRILKKVTMEPSERLANLQALWDSQTVAELGPCGGFSQMYACVCDWLGFPYREEVQWDVDTIYLTQDTRELNLQDFSHLDHRDLIPIVAALEYNQWFTKLSSKDLKLSTDVCEQILRVVSRSNRLEELVLENAGLRTDFAQKLASALAHNPNSGLHTINLASNPLEDRGVSSLSIQFAKLPKGLKHLNLSKTSLSPKGVNSLSQSLSANSLIANTLVYLDLSGNALRGDDLSSLYNFLAQPNALVHLDLSNTECALDMVCGALLRGCLQHLAVLSLSRTLFSHRKGKEVPPSFKQFFSSSLALMQINLSGTKLPPEPLKALLLGLACNHNLKEVSLDLSSCELRSGGAQVLEGCIAEIHNITSLDISDNGLESDLSTLVVWLSKNRSIRHLALGKNFNNMKSKNLTPVLDNLVQMIQDEDSPLQSLSLADSKLKTEVTIIINALGSNTSLTKVDISGNAMGDMGAKMLAKALQINTKLRTVIWDKNNITAQGFQDIAVALEKNYTLRFMPIPMNDASQALKTNPEKTEEALQKIENYLLRNHETRKYLQEQAYRLQQGIVTSTTQQMIDRICVKVQDHLNSLRNCGVDAVQEDVKSAERLMRDAKNSKTLLPNLYHLGGASWAGANGSLSNPIQETLESMAGEVTRVVDEQLKTLLESMVDAAENLCPNVMKKARIREDLIEASTEKISIPRTFVKNVLLEQSGIDILNKISEVKLTVASFLSDRVVDEILDALSHCHHKLADHLTRRGKPLPQQESLEIELAEEKPTKRSIITVEELTEIERLEDLDTCMMTPKSKRKSIHSRMLRPVSRAFEMEFDLDKALEEVPIHIEDPPFPSSRPDKRTSGFISELPSEEGRKLEHFTKLRPKRNKKQQPSQAAVSAGVPPEGDQNGLMGRVDEGVDEFFTKKVTKMDSKRPSTKSSDSSEPSEAGDEKKKRDSRKSGFLNLIKSRGSKSERPQTVLVAEEPSSPKVAAKSPAVDTGKKEIKPAEQNGGTERSEELKTPDSLEEAQPDDAAKAERGDSKGSPQGGRRYGVQVMGSGLLAEMKAKQEKRAASAQKKLGNDTTPRESFDTAMSSERLDGSGTVPKLQQTLPESRFASNKGDSISASTEKNSKAEPKAEAGAKARSSSNTPTSPKPPLQSTKPSLAGRPTVPQKPRSASRTEDAPESPSGPSSPKVVLLPPVLKKVPSDKEKDGQSSPTVRSFSQEAAKRSPGQQSHEFQELKQKSLSKDGHQGSKSSDSGEEADKDFIFV